MCFVARRRPVFILHRIFDCLLKIQLVFLLLRDDTFREVTDHQEQDGAIEDETQNNEKANSTDELLSLLRIIFIAESDAQTNDREDKIAEVREEYEQG